jgi:hypothetical protein
MNSGTKINKLLREFPPGVVLLSSWLASNGYSYELQQRYRKGGWLSSIGRGALIRSGEKPTLVGAIYSLQRQEKIQIHFGGKTALQMHGLAHFIELQAQNTFLFAPRGVGLPSWMKNYEWGSTPILVNTAFLPPGLGLTNYVENGIPVYVSSPVRAILESLYLVSDKFSLEEAYQMMDGLSFITPGDAQTLLEQCSSIKVTRLFLFLAKKTGHAWFKHLQPEKMSLGTGKRVLFSEGTYVRDLKITIPKEMM